MFVALPNSRFSQNTINNYEMARSLLSHNLILQLLLGFVLFGEISPYEKIYLENKKLCHYSDHEDPTVVKLGVNEAKAVVHGRYFDRWSGKYNFSCKFFVKAPSKYGIYAVIQYLNFRRDPIKGCLDYVKIEVPHKFTMFFTTKSSKIFCGKIMPKVPFYNISRDYEDGLNQSLVSENGFVAKDDLILVKIHVQNEKLKPDEKLDIEIVFTAFKYDCYKKKDKAILCKECQWISDEFAMDGVQNCPYLSCLDEDYCRNVDIKHELPTVLVSSETGTKVSIGAVATIIIVLLVFGCCVWVSRRMKLWCFDPSRNRQARMEMNSTERATGLDEGNNHYGDVFPENLTPSAPPLPDDKDLPPSYSSLFPGK